MEYGEKISALRKSRGMTQSELGSALNVTFQAVSKWERGESYPDFETLSKISKIFGVPISYFEDGETLPEAQPVAAKPMLGVCTVCGKGIYDEEEIAQTQPALICKDCVQRRADAEKKAKQEAADKAKRAVETEKWEAKRMRNRGLIASAAICAAILVILIISVIIDPTDAGSAFAGYAIMLVFLFPFIAQLFWHGFIVDVVLCGGKIIGGPGVIFSLDLDGIIFLIVFKLIFFVIKILFFFLTIIFFALVAIFLSPFTFIPATVKLSRGILPD